ncbi:hypothetical protein L7F22_031931 [Adiantum nelumboides]|nr:hypothetical protein [Adiantum nelumboides]
MDVVNPEQARIAEEAGACAVMALERVPADIRVQVPFVCGCRNLGEALRRISEGAAMIRTKVKQERETLSKQFITKERSSRDQTCSKYV